MVSFLGERPGCAPAGLVLQDLLAIYENRLDRRFTWELRATLEELARRADLPLDDLPEPTAS